MATTRPTRPDILPATLGDVLDVAVRMRQADRDEIAALGMNPVDGLVRTFRNSVVSWAWRQGESTLAVFGVCSRSFTSDEGTPWLITVHLTRGQEFGFLRCCRDVFDYCYGRYRLLENVVDDRHVVAKRWLKWMGFRFSEPEPFGPLGVPFRRFELRRD